MTDWNGYDSLRVESAGFQKWNLNRSFELRASR